MGGMERQRAAMQAATDLCPPGSVEAFAAMGTAYLRFAEAEPGVFRLMFALTRSLKDSGPVIEAGRATFGVPLGQVAIRLRRPPTDAEVIRRSFMLWTFVHGLAFLLIDEKAQAMQVSVDVPGMVAEAARRLLAD
jgi:hypothetical protein